jgi:tetratricopeptide (TPR) repeat protein
MRIREFLTLAFAPLGGALGLGSFAVFGPWSPLALDDAAMRFAAGDSRGAIVAYEREAKGWRTPTVRAHAWAASARLRQAEGDSRGAVRALENAVDLEPDQPARIALLEALAGLYEGPLGDPRACAEAFEQAAAEGAAASTELASARCWLRAEEEGAARAALDRAAALSPATGAVPP